MAFTGADSHTRARLAHSARCTHPLHVERYTWAGWVAGVNNRPSCAACRCCGRAAQTTQRGPCTPAATTSGGWRQGQLQQRPDAQGCSAAGWQAGGRGGGAGCAAVGDPLHTHVSVHMLQPCSANGCGCLPAASGVPCGITRCQGCRRLLRVHVRCAEHSTGSSTCQAVPAAGQPAAGDGICLPCVGVIGCVAGAVRLAGGPCKQLARRRACPCCVAAAARQHAVCCSWGQWQRCHITAATAAHTTAAPAVGQPL